MRIALYHNLPSGGAKRTLSEAAKRLAAAHHIDVYTLTSANHNFADIRPYVANYQMFDFDPLPLLSSPFGRLNQAIRLLDLFRLDTVSKSMVKTIEQNVYDVVLVHPCQFETGPTILKYLQTIPSVYYCHEPLRRLYEPMPFRPYENGETTRRQLLNKIDPLPTFYHKTLRNVDRRNTRSAGTVLVNSKFICEAVRQIYQVAAQVSYHGIDTEWFRPLNLEKKNIILSVGSLTPLKGFDFVIRALAELAVAKRPTLVIASNFQNPSEKHYLEQLSLDLNVDMTLLSNISDTDLLQLYNQAKFVVYTPIREPFGLVPLEAMACGTPVVTVREGGIQETVVDKYTGLLVERDPIQFAEAMQCLISDPTLAQKYGNNGRPYVLQNWTWGRATTTLENFLTAQADSPAT